jgi:hypothetical protein
MFMPDRRSLSRYGYVVAGLLGGWAIVFAPLMIERHQRGAPSPEWIVILTASAALAMVWACIFATLAFRKLDEFQRAASKFAWYWGGTIGFAASLPVFFFTYMGGLHWLDPARFRLGADVALAFRLGYGLAAVSVTLGFFVGLAVWRIAKR